jgi:UDP-N-acetylglucosamine 4,6-dehydratase/5-epimerase
VENIALIAGGVLARHMKAALIKDLLTVWIEDNGGRWERITGRPGERDDEFLIGEIELPYARVLDFGGIEHYLIKFNERSAEPPARALSSANTDRMTREEMAKLISAAAE